MSKKDTSMVKYKEEYLASQAKLGMSKVDPKDIRPPQIRLIQKSSTLGDFMDAEGNPAKVGQFFHTGRLQILKTFEAYLLFAAKGKYTNRLKPELGILLQYTAIGAMADDLSMFGMTFRSSALFTLSPLFTSVISQKRPMYSIKVRFETKELTGEKGSWFIPVLRVLEAETDEVTLDILEKQALMFEQKASDMVVPEEEGEEKTE